MSKVAFLSTGEMGSRMVANLLENGHQVTVWNRDLGELSALVDKGARPVGSPRAAAAEAEYVISMVQDDQASRDVWLGEADGALAGMPGEAVAIESTMLTVAWVKELADHCRRRGIALLDAPVAGTLQQAEAGQLIYFVGGDPGVFEEATPLLLAMGSAVHYAGLNGSGASTKQMVNLMMGIPVFMVGAALEFVRHLEFDEDSGLVTVTSTPAANPPVIGTGKPMLEDKFASMFSIDLAVEDFASMVEAMISNGAEVPEVEMDITETLYVTTRQEWREWLAENYDSQPEIWLVSYKKKAGRPSIPYNEAVEEALCFGWIDSIRKGLDDERTVQRFSPRKAGSSYSQTNQERLARLIKAGKVIPAVLEKLPDIRPEAYQIPADILSALQSNPEAWAFFQGTSPSYQRIRAAYVDGARKRPGEFDKRLANLIEKSASGKQFGYGIEDYY